MSKPGGLSKLGPPNVYERERPECACDRPLPERGEDGVECAKCGRPLFGRLSRRLKETV